MINLARALFRRAFKFAEFSASELRKLKLRCLYPNCRFGRAVRIGPGVTFKITDGGSCYIGDRTLVKDNVVIIVKRGELTIGKDSFVGWGSVICSNEKISIGDYGLIAENVTIRDQNHGMAIDDIPFAKQPMTTQPIQISNNVWIGAKSSILAGVSIGSSTIIGAHSVVTKEIPAFRVACGIPAKVIRVLSSQG